MDRIAGILEVSRTEDTHEIMICHLDSTIGTNRPGHVVISARQARHLANVLLDHAEYAEAEAKGHQPGTRAYHRKVREIQPTV
jgi:hypothetical protein